MLKILKNNTAQIIFGEYVLVLFLIVAAATGMSVYFKRAIQSRIHEATMLPARAVVEGASEVRLERVPTRRFPFYEYRGVRHNFYVGNVYAQYEPYYLNTVSQIEQNSFTHENLLGSQDRRTGIFNKTTNDGTAVKTDSDTAAPRFGAGR